MGQKLNIKALREEKGWSQRELSKKVGVSPAAVCFWENGTTLPTARMLMLLCAAFDCALNDLFTKE